MVIKEKINVTVNIVRNILDECCFPPELDSMLADIPAKIEEPLQLAIVGRISSSKSTLVNAILGKEEVVKTGAKEVTWNVNWLKYGDEAAITAYYKDEKFRPEKIEKCRWQDMANRSSDDKEQLKNDISYFEIKYPEADILKKVNIIDTPGLSSHYGKDSQNTMYFLEKMKPDAIVLVFSKGLNKNIVMDVKNLRQQIGAGFSPMNAIGVLARIDDYWNNDGKDPLEEGKKNIRNDVMSNEMVKNMLFNAYPVSAFTALAACRITEADVKIMENIAKLPENEIDDIFSSYIDFKEAFPEHAQHLLDICGRYGVWEIVKHLKKTGNSELTAIRELLRQKSGFKDFWEILNTHFTQEATTIKAINPIVSCMAKMREIAGTYPDDIREKWVMERAISEMDKLMIFLKLRSNVAETKKQWYEGKLKIKQEDFEELRRVNGEAGNSIRKRTGLNDHTTTQEVVDYCSKRIVHWRNQLNTTGKMFPSSATFIKQILALYAALKEFIVLSEPEYKTYKEFFN